MNSISTKQSGGGVTGGRRGFIGRGVYSGRGGLPACNGAAGKRLLRRRCYGWWREILHDEMADGGEVLYPPKRSRFDVRIIIKTLF